MSQTTPVAVSKIYKRVLCVALLVLVRPTTKQAAALRSTVLVALVSLFVVVLPTQAETRDVYPTGTAVDMRRVSDAISTARPNDIVLLHARNEQGQLRDFDWSANHHPIFPLKVPFGVIVGISSIIIRGEIDSSGQPLTAIVGPTEQGFPRLESDHDTIPFSRRANAAFLIGPSVVNVTIQNVNFRDSKIWTRTDNDS